MNLQPSVVNVFCGELSVAPENKEEKSLKLSYFDLENFDANINIGFNKFINDIESLPPRIIDLLEIAAYVFCADRAVDRGERNSINNNSWARSFQFYIPVRDNLFWSNPKVSAAISSAMEFMTGDRKYSFQFEKYEQIPNIVPNHQLSLFNNEYITISEAKNTEVMLFSGGLDSLAGVIEYLNTFKSKELCLVSHKANNSVTHTQNSIIGYLQKRYNHRIKHYNFECHFKKNTPSKEETQRSRMFLYSAIAFAICNCYEKQEFYVYENGITSINLPKQADTFNARASRTTHPKAIALLQKFYRYFSEEFSLLTPYSNKTKADILQIFKNNNEQNIISSSVSCSSTRNKPGIAAHCGCCSQCIDRRFAVFATELEEYDAEYADDFIRHIPNSETRQRLYNTLRLAAMEGMKSKQDFIEKYMDEIADIIDYTPGSNPDDKMDDLYKLFCRFGQSVLFAAKRIQAQCEDLSAKNPKDSLLEMLATREHLATPTLSRVNEIDQYPKVAIPLMFQREPPANENDFNDKVQALLVSKGDFEREYPVLQFGITSYKADHSQDMLLIESKYIRSNTSPSVATNGIASDITLVPNEFGLYFVVYDPERRIGSDMKFISNLESKRESCFVRIYR
ncbi:MAG: 7-cyano-7-deazaguanine synthase [Pelotomaculum sp. PtaU1.Bin065]|nr:MAG: 7-cyano-7-deazaguanine synthase [Pelotomaculum sp. PtaU1.Bin065]